MNIKEIDLLEESLKKELENIKLREAEILSQISLIGEIKKHGLGVESSTISYRLGKIIIDTKSAKDVFLLPKKLFELRQYAVKRKENRIDNFSKKISKKSFTDRKSDDEKIELTDTKNLSIKDDNLKKQKDKDNVIVKYESKKFILQTTKNSDFIFSKLWKEYYFFKNIGIEYVKLEKSTETLRIYCLNSRILILNLDLFNKENYSEKQSVLSMLFYDKLGNLIEPNVNIPFSQRLKKYYFYLNSTPDLLDYIALPVSTNCNHVEISIEAWDKKGELFLSNQLLVDRLQDGISVILPSYQGEKTIERCLKSLAVQSLDFCLFEIILVINGKQDNSRKIIELFMQNNPNINLKFFELKEANVGNARNFAIQQAKMSWVTFIDDDDWVSENFLLSLYSNANYDRVVLTGIEDVKEGNFIPSPVMKQLDAANNKKKLKYSDVSSILTMNACKLAPTFMVKNIHYDTTLRSGEDVVYWVQLLNTFQPEVNIVEDYDKVTYKRLVRENSVSRKSESYDFNVRQRLEVICGLEKQLDIAKNQDMINFIQSKINAQSGFVKRYLTKFPNEYHKFIKDVKLLGLNNYFIHQINHQFARTLLISYCYAPYIDTSGVVMGKRVNAMRRPVDLISNNMDKVRETDNKLIRISNLYLGRHIELNAPQSFANWKSIQRFVELSLDATHNLIKSGKEYDELYSRAMWPASHMAAALIKIKYPQMKWVAEFSDPILFDVSAKERFEEISVDWLVEQGFVSHKNDRVSNNLFHWCEQLPYLFADELIFTNINQLNYMLSYIDSQQKDLILSKAKVIPQPTLDREFYEISQANLAREKGFVYLGYFGSFYINRGFKPFIDAWSELPDSEKYKLKLYVYTQQDAQSLLSDVPDDLKKCIVLQKYVGYFDFLALSDQFDGLLVIDAQTKGEKLNNPYLPSKISDYLGSNATTLALVEEGSPMSVIESEKLIKIDMFKSKSIQNALIDFICNYL